MNYVKMKYLKNDKPQGRAYTFKAEEELNPGDILDLPGGKHGVVVDEPVDMGWIESYGVENLKGVKKHMEESEVSADESIRTSS